MPEPIAPAPQKRSAKAEPEKATKQEPPKPVLEPVVDFDAETLFAQAIDEGLAESMFDPEALSNIAESLDAEGGDRVGYDEAVNMGILDE
jgi:hypothetical protein